METHALYNGEVILKYDDDKHLYYVDDKVVPGVTGVMHIINKPALVGWAAKMCAEYLVNNLKPGKALDEIEIVQLANQMKHAHRQHTERASDIGTLAHLYIENAIKYKLGLKKEPPEMPFNQEAQNCIHAFADWTARNKVEWIASEAKIYSREMGFAGTLDIDAVVNDERCIIDIKTSNGIWPEYLLQTAAYQCARQEELNIKYAARWILRIGKDGIFEAKRFDNFDRDIFAFYNALKLSQLMGSIKQEFKQAA